MGGVTDELLVKRGEFVARRRVLKGELTKLAADIAAIDRVIRMVDPDHQTVEQQVERKAISPFVSGELTPAALEALRKLGPTTSSACAEAILSAKGMPTDPATVAHVANRVSAIFSQKANNGQVSRAGSGTGRQLIWQIAA
jgi:hypothetical protein